MSILPATHRHSASSGNCFRESPDTFIWKYALGNKGPTNSKMASGSAVEKALAAVLVSGFDAEAAAAMTVEFYDMEMAGVIEPERADLPDMLKQALEALAPLGKPLTHQMPVDLQAGVHYGLRYPIIGYTDFGYPDFTLDLKCTWKLPSAPSFGHMLQMAVYWRLQDGKPQKLAYVTPKKQKVYDLAEEDLEHGWRVMLSNWRAIEALDRRCSSAADAIALIPINPDSFRWRGADMATVLNTWGV